MHRSLIVILVSLLVLFSPNFLQTRITDYRISDCSSLLPAFYYVYYESSNLLRVKVLVNCCTDIRIEKKTGTYILKESGNICKCMCPKTIEVYRAEKPQSVVFTDYTGREVQVPAVYIETNFLGGYTGHAGEKILVIPGTVENVRRELLGILKGEKAPQETFSTGESLNLVIFRGVFHRWLRTQSKRNQQGGQHVPRRRDLSQSVCWSRGPGFHPTSGRHTFR